ncbi:serine/threonine-protein phosphatase 7 long form homolog [Nicotiana tomentosiformis]|uniref:serine/threonine-protein phosphatase 7 long form homolog n=1 Tax=Nicotiana tomentosiformis TaxID=4098 RepID=UPI00388CC0BE
MDAEITDDSPSEVIDRHTKLVLLLMFGGVLFPNTSGNLFSLRFLHYLEQLDDLPGYSWGETVLGYLYRQMCRASIGTQRDVAEFLPLLQRPYSDALIAGLPDYCSCGRAIWSSYVPLICIDIVEHHATERVLRQFGRPQLVPIPPAWLRTHYQRDDRSRVDQTNLNWIEAQIEVWDQRYDLIPPPPAPEHTDGEHEYMGWYHIVTRLHVGNPVHRAGGRYIPYAGRQEALDIGLYQFYQLGLQMLLHTGEGAAALHKYGHRVTDLAAQTLRRARDDERLGYEAAYVQPEENHHRPPVEPGHGRRGRHGKRERGVPRGRGSRRGWCPLKGGVEAPVEDIRDHQPVDHPEPHDPPHDMPSFSLQLSLGTSQLTPSASLLIVGTIITQQEWD